MKWGSNGELTAVDLGLVLKRLALVDQEVTGLRTGSLLHGSPVLKVVRSAGQWHYHRPGSGVVLCALNGG